MTNPTAPAAADPAAFVDNAVTNSGSSFLTAMRFLPPDKRQAMYALYAYCREVDDIADESGTPEEKRQRLAEWRVEIERMFNGAPGMPISCVLSDAVARFDLQKADLLALIDGMEMDAARTVRIADEAELALYCDRVACSVGRLSNRIFGVAPEASDALARALGDALQMTNILRDLAEDAERDRLYVPISLLGAHGISEVDDAAGILAHPRFPEACAALAAKTRRQYAVARAIMAGCERRAVRPAAIMMEVYRAILLRLEARGWRHLDKAVAVPRLLKLWIALRHGVL
ncbi:presqualene diphosphate synthase HpnD [Shumkonia mesophila]|uniref:presqualene diphosphate synthase HpnD n=1 Tax=Shumkonia mesophila TaxID=2838854 RepID=UPI00293506A4|nr:presqualene diphosphate synthase HpnD [Shumkonia mesophila]